MRAFTGEGTMRDLIRSFENRAEDHNGRLMDLRNVGESLEGSRPSIGERDPEQKGAPSQSGKLAEVKKGALSMSGELAEAHRGAHVTLGKLDGENKGILSRLGKPDDGSGGSSKSAVGVFRRRKGLFSRDIPPGRPPEESSRLAPDHVRAHHSPFFSFFFELEIFLKKLSTFFGSPGKMAVSRPKSFR